MKRTLWRTWICDLTHRGEYHAVNLSVTATLGDVYVLSSHRVILLVIVT